MVFGAAPREVAPLLARALMRRNKYVSAMACLRKALADGATEQELALELQQIERALGIPLTRWRALIASSPS